MKTNVFKQENLMWFGVKSVVKSFFLALVITIVFGFAFGYKYINIVSSSMAPYMPIDTIIIVKFMPIESVEIGDVVTYKKTGSQTNVTHRVVGFDAATGGLLTAPESFYQTLLTNPDREVTAETPGVDSAAPIAESEIVGVVVAHFVGLGAFFDFIKENIIQITIGLILMLFIFNFV